MLDRLQSAEPPAARGRFAIERVLANVEIEGGEVRVHEGGQGGDRAGEIEICVSLPNPSVEFRELVQHKPVEIGHRRGLDPIAIPPMRERPEHPADGVAQLSVIVADGLQDIRPDALVVGIVDARRPQPQDVGARGRMTSCGKVWLPSDFDILRPCSSSVKPCVSTTSNGARPRVPQLSSREDWNQPRCWSEPSRYITVSAAVDVAADAGEPGKWTGSSSTKAWVEPESNQTSTRLSIFS